MSTVALSLPHCGVQYEGGEPCSVCGHTLARTDDSANRNSAFPTEILPGFLYLGSYDNASRSELLKTVGITHILNVSFHCLIPNFRPVSGSINCSDMQTVPTCQNLYKNSFHYHTAGSKPPDFSECFSYLGMQMVNVLLVSVIAPEASTVIRTAPAPADSVQQEKGRVLVHCMTGTSM